MKFARVAVLACICVGAFGCSSDEHSDLREFVKESEKLPRGRIPPLPEVAPPLPGAPPVAVSPPVPPVAELVPPLPEVDPPVPSGEPPTPAQALKINAPARAVARTLALMANRIVRPPWWG